MTAQQFSDCLHTPFQVRVSPTQHVPMHLIRVAERNDSPSLDQFSLIFRGPMTPVLPQATREFLHERLGSLQLFMVPVGPDESGICYEVVFNKLRK